LKNWLNRDLSREDKVLLVLATFDAPCQVNEVKARAYDAGFKVPKSWNVSELLRRSEGKAIRTPAGWEITDAGRQHLTMLGISKIGPAAVQVALDLRAHLENIKDDDTRAFVAEAIGCYEHEFYRSAVIMSWIAAVYVLQQEVLTTHLANFNAEIKRINSKWKNAKTVDDLSLLKENEFLDRLTTLSIIGKNTKTELKQCLDLRNACGHPNSFKLGPNAVARHLEMLLLNVFEKFS
jgi:hypothetical protein